MAEDENKIVRGELGREIVYTKLRSSRPQDFVQPRHEKTLHPSKCFFCPGNEHLTPPELDKVSSKKVKDSAEGTDSYWCVRCFENKFPAVRTCWKEAYGYHDIIVETPRHELTVSQLSSKHWAAFLGLVKRHVAKHQKDKKIKYTIVFKNEGGAAGASLEHTHTQVVSLDYVPAQIATISKQVGKVMRKWQQEKKNILLSSGGFDVICPPLSQYHFEMMVVPQKKAASLIDLGNEEIAGLAGAIKKALEKLDKTTGFGPYNIVYIFAPKGDKKFNMFVRIMPRLSIWAGFELGCGTVMSSVPPGAAIEILKQA